MPANPMDRLAALKNDPDGRIEGLSRTEKEKLYAIDEKFDTAIRSLYAAAKSDPSIEGDITTIIEAYSEVRFIATHERSAKSE